MSATGEWAAALAVVASLIYLAIQIKQNSKQLAESAKRATQSAIYQQNLVAAQDKDVAAILRRGMKNNNDLDPEEWARFHSYWMTIFITYQEAYKEVKKVGTDDDFWNIIQQHALTYLSTPGLSIWWQKNKYMFNDEFVSHFDSRATEGT